MKSNYIKCLTLSILVTALPIVLYAVLTDTTLNVNRLPESNSTVNGRGTGSIGYRNTIHSLLNSNDVDVMRGSVAVGSWHDLHNLWQFTAGYGNTLGSQRQVALGKGLSGPYNADASLLVGRYNDVTEYTDRIIFGVGNGTSSSNKSNALTIFEDGSVIIHDPSDEIPMYVP